MCLVVWQVQITFCSGFFRFGVHEFNFFCSLCVASKCTQMFAFVIIQSNAWQTDSMAPTTNKTFVSHSWSMSLMLWSSGLCTNEIFFSRNNQITLMCNLLNKKFQAQLFTGIFIVSISFPLVIPNPDYGKKHK